MSEQLDGFIVARKDGSLHCVAVDRGDYADVAAAGPWYVYPDHHTFYAARKVRRPDGRRQTERLHRFLLGLAPGDKREVDHRGGNGLLNTRESLHLVTHAENQQNQTPHRDGSSKYRGVGWDPRTKKWRAQVTHNGVNHTIGRFTSEEDAARAAEAGRARLFTHANEERHPVAASKKKRAAATRAAKRALASAA